MHYLPRYAGLVLPLRFATRRVLLVASGTDRPERIAAPARQRAQINSVAADVSSRSRPPPIGHSVLASACECPGGGPRGCSE